VPARATPSPKQALAGESDASLFHGSALGSYFVLPHGNVGPVRWPGTACRPYRDFPVAPFPDILPRNTAGFCRTRCTGETAACSLCPDSRLFVQSPPRATQRASCWHFAQAQTTKDVTRKLLHTPERTRQRSPPVSAGRLFVFRGHVLQDTSQTNSEAKLNPHPPTGFQSPLHPSKKRLPRRRRTRILRFYGTIHTLRGLCLI